MLDILVNFLLSLSDGSTIHLAHNLQFDIVAYPLSNK